MVSPLCMYSQVSIKGFRVSSIVFLPHHSPTNQDINKLLSVESRCHGNTASEEEGISPCLTAEEKQRQK